MAFITKCVKGKPMNIQPVKITNPANYQNSNNNNKQNVAFGHYSSSITEEGIKKQFMPLMLKLPC